MLREKLVVRAMWDEDARVFVATSDDVPRLVTEAETLEALRRKLDVMIPELLELNGGSEPFSNDEAELIVLSEHHSRVRLRA